MKNNRKHIILIVLLFVISVIMNLWVRRGGITTRQDTSLYLAQFTIAFIGLTGVVFLWKRIKWKSVLYYIYFVLMIVIISTAIFEIYQQSAHQKIDADNVAKMTVNGLIITDEEIIENICDEYNKISAIRRNPWGDGIVSEESILKIDLENGTGISVTLNGKELDVSVNNGDGDKCYWGRQDELVQMLLFLS